MSDRQGTPERGHDDSGTDLTTIAFTIAEEALDEATETITAAREATDGEFADDLETIDDHVEHIEDAIDTAEDQGGSTHLSEVAATLDYAQSLTEIIRTETSASEVTDLANALEAVEEQFEDVVLPKTTFFATVDRIPNLYQQQEVPAQRLKNDGDISEEPSDYTLYAVPTASSDIADREEEFSNNEKADVDKWDHFLTEKDEGGVV